MVDKAESLAYRTHAQLFALLGLFIILIISGCSLFGESGDKTHIKVTGQVLNAQDQTPIENASVIFGKGGFFEEGTIARQMTTDEQGKYSFEYTEDGYCAPSLFYIRANAEGFYQKTYNDGIQCSEELQTIDLQLEPFP